jgi:hypothetical protein
MKAKVNTSDLVKLGVVEREEDDEDEFNYFSVLN